MRDGETDLSRSDTQLFVDNRKIAVYGYDRATDRLRGTVGPLKPGRHTVRVRATDAAGLTEDRAWGFKVTR